jgi:4-hydroxybenzoate polyprenyltransferase
LRLFWDWLVGRRNFREGLFAIYTPRVTTLPYNRELLNYLSGQSASGRKVYVAPGADPKITREVAKHLELPEVSPTPGDDKSPDGNNPVSLMASAAGSPQFCYAGSPTRSAEIWRRCGSAIVVGGSPQAPRKIADVCRVEQSFPANRSGLATYLRAMRAYQWVKNALLIVPLLPGLGQMTPHRFVLVGVGFAAFCLCSSSFYVINDLLDLASDRRHPSKRARPFAAGILSVQRGLLLAACLFVAGVSLAALVSPTFLAATALYLAGTAAYSLGGKRLVLIDVLILAGLYALRVAAGAIAAKLSLSFWMLAFSMALFLSLAFVKRYGELQSLAKRGEEWPPGRGYRAADMPLLEMFGIGTGLGAVLTLSLYLEQDAARASFRHPFVLAALCPVLLYWIFRVWLHAHRGMMHEDPVVFAITDRVSRFVLLIAAAIVAVAHL